MSNGVVKQHFECFFLAELVHNRGTLRMVLFWGRGYLLTIVSVAFQRSVLTGYHRSVASLDALSA